MSKAFLDKSRQNSDNHRDKDNEQKKTDPIAYLKWLDNTTKAPTWGSFENEPHEYQRTTVAQKSGIDKVRNDVDEDINKELGSPFEREPITREDAEKKIEEYRKILTEKLEKTENYTPLPKITYIEKGLGSNAQYDSKTNSILIAPNFFNKGEIDGDKISIIYHEYIHFLNDQENKFPVTYDDEGNIKQWDTDEMISILPTDSEIENDLKQMMELLPPNVSDEDRKKLEQSYRYTLSQPTLKKMKYAPSNLSLDEISAYKGQLEGFEKQYYNLSPAYIIEIKERITIYEEQYKRRLEYEKTNGLNIDGSKKTN